MRTVSRDRQRPPPPPVFVVPACDVCGMSRLREVRGEEERQRGEVCMMM